MPPYIRLVYISRSTFLPGTDYQGIDPGVARILARSRKNNREADIVGGLLFGDGCFFQCLEGAPAAVDRLYAKIAADPRHTDVKLVARVPIARRSFTDWSMKFVPMEKLLRTLLASQGLTRFNPYVFTAANFEAVLEYLRSEHDASAYAGLGLGAAPAVPEAQAPAQASAEPAQIARAWRRANWALGMALLSLLLAAGSLAHALR